MQNQGSSADTQPQKLLRQSVGLFVLAIWTATISAGLLFVNAAFVYSLYQTILNQLPIWFSLVPVGQLIFFVAPVLLLYLEWMAWDWVSARWRSQHWTLPNHEATRE